MNKHTPGPWGCVYTSFRAHDYRLTRPDGMMIVNAPANDHSEQRANARLIAAAPDLLAALHSMHNAAKALHELHNDSEWLELMAVEDTYITAVKQYNSVLRKIEGE